MNILFTIPVWARRMRHGPFTCWVERPLHTAWNLSPAALLVDYPSTCLLSAAPSCAHQTVPGDNPRLFRQVNRRFNNWELTVFFQSSTLTPLPRVYFFGRCRCQLEYSANYYSNGAYYYDGNNYFWSACRLRLNVILVRHFVDFCSRPSENIRAYIFTYLENKTKLAVSKTPCHHDKRQEEGSMKRKLTR